MVKKINFSQLSDDIQNKRKAYRKALASGLNTLSGGFVTDVKNNLRGGSSVSAYDTGELHDSIESKRDRTHEYIVSANAPHAFWVHEGTTGMPPRPYFNYTYEQNKERYLKFLNKVIQESMR